MAKGRNIKNFVKSQPLFDVHRQYLQRLRCRNFYCYAYFLKIQHDYHRVLSFTNYPFVIVLHLESFENNLFELDFSISKKTCFYCQTFSGR